MCGIFGALTLLGRESAIDDAQAIRLRDMLSHRGPDGAGLWRRDNALLAHRRLAVIDPCPEANQPMATHDGRFVIVYNGELYNDAEVRRDLLDQGAVPGGFRTRCDTETVLRALATWGVDAVERLRGMFALAVYDAQRKRLTLARDALGVKPLYYWLDGREFIFASEPAAILAHPRVSAQPNPRMVSAYLTTIRTVVGSETLFAGVKALPPGHVLECDFSAQRLAPKLRRWWSGPEASSADEAADGVERVRSAVSDSVRRHLRSDVPTCALLSGGLDSTVIVSIVAGERDGLRTYAAGAGTDELNDLHFAQRVAERLGLSHTTRHLSREYFIETWRWLVDRLGVPLSTPNEVAIYAVAERLRRDGRVVTLSGEGADELFGGYGAPLAAASEFERQRRRGLESMPGGRFQLEANAWIPPTNKHLVLREHVHGVIEDDHWLATFYEQEFDRLRSEVGADVDPIEAHLRLLRSINLSGLLQRLDTATMLASVEGRTPYADARVAETAERLPMTLKYKAPAESDANVVTESPERTKLALRDAFRGRAPREGVERAKVSFPLPFERWIEGAIVALERSEFAREWFTQSARRAAADDPSVGWRLGWPMINLAMWGQRWWG